MIVILRTVFDFTVSYIKIYYYFVLFYFLKKVYPRYK